MKRLHLLCTLLCFLSVSGVDGKMTSGHDDARQARGRKERHGKQSPEKTVYLQDYLDLDPSSSEDAAMAIGKAVDECRKSGAERLVLPGGTLNIMPDRASERYEYISNNDPSMKRIAFLLDGIENLTIEGNGTLLMLSGFVSAFSLDACRNITVRDLSIDYSHPFVAEGEVAAAGEGWFEFRFPDKAGAVLDGGVLCFRDSRGREYPYLTLLEFDSRRREVAWHAHDYWLGGRCRAEKTEDGNYRIDRGDFGEAVPGNIMVFGAAARLHPAFTLLDCSGFLLENVNIWSCCGMGVIAQCSRDIELRNVKVEPSPGSGRMISASADATHFVNCKGYIRMIDCVFRNQKDDATNIHGLYMAVERVIAPDRLLLKWRNSGQYGVRFIKPGMSMELVDNETMMSYAGIKVKSVEYLNSEYAEVEFTAPLPGNVKENHVVAEDDGYPDVLISGCYIGNNRARGLLLGSRGRTVVEKCTFHTPGAAILLEGDGNYWYEQSGVRDLLIRDNVFDSCMYGNKSWGSACIAVGSGIPSRESSRYHRNVTVENNTFITIDNRIVNLYCVDGFIYRGNEVRESSDYPVCGSASDRIIINDCSNVEID